MMEPHSASAVEFIDNLEIEVYGSGRLWVVEMPGFTFDT